MGANEYVGRKENMSGDGRRHGAAERPKLGVGRLDFKAVSQTEFYILWRKPRRTGKTLTRLTPERIPGVRDTSRSGD